ncbi:MAG: beta-N-acetylhexosaminidase [bacterium]|nr:beta-N-acetylhexosaminidase [bacterium]
MIVPGRDARRAAGRLCLVDFPGTAPSSALERLIADRHILGVVLFRKNITSPVQVAQLTDALLAIAQDAGAPPPWVTIDHEGGAVTRFPPRSGDPQLHATTLPPRVTPLPSAMALGAAGDPALAQAAGRIAGRELRAMGIHLNFAPVLDVNTNPSNPIIGARAFGDSPASVAAMGLAYIRGLQSSGVAATAKHFPGHGDTTMDSHLGLPRVDHGRERLEAVELAPFAAAVRAGVAGIMTAHIVYPALDPSGVPATLSAPILTGILREHWGFGGLVFTDSMSMRAIADHYGMGDAAVAAVRAGCDAVLALGEEPAQQEVLDRLAVAIEQGEISGARLAETRARVAAAAGGWGVGNPRPTRAEAADCPTAMAGLDAVDASEHERIAAQIAAAAVTLVRDRPGILPLPQGLLSVVSIPCGTSDPSGPLDGVGPDLAYALRRHGAVVGEIHPHDVSIPDGPVVAVTCVRGTPDPGTVAAVRTLHRLVGDRLIVVAAGDPYDLALLPEIPVYVATYGPDEPSLNAAARVLLGQARAGGKMPVNLGDTADEAPGALG